MKNNVKLFFSCVLSTLALGACGAQEADTPDTEAGLVQLDIAFVGAGEIAIEEPYVESCSSELDSCSFLFELGTILHVGGLDFAIEADTLVVVNQSGRDFGQYRDYGFIPGQPGMIVDPVGSEPYYIHHQASKGAVQVD